MDEDEESLIGAEDTIGPDLEDVDESILETGIEDEVSGADGETRDFDRGFSKSDVANLIHAKFVVINQQQSSREEELSFQQLLELPTSEWYRQCVSKNKDAAGRVASFIAAVAFIPNGLKESILEATDNLADLLGKYVDPTETLDRLLRDVGGQLGRSESWLSEKPFETLRLCPDNRSQEARAYLWEQFTHSRAEFRKWLVGLGMSPNREVSLRVGAAIGALACEYASRDPGTHELKLIFTHVIDQWANQGGHGRQALGSALAQLDEVPAARDFLRERLSKWSNSNKTSQLKAAITICRSNWGTTHVEEATRTLMAAEPYVRNDNSSAIQAAINNIWLNAAGDDAAGFTKAATLSSVILESASRQQRVFSWRPQLRICRAISTELRERANQLPIVLRSLQQGSLPLAQSIAMIFAIGLHRAETQNEMQQLLSNLQKRAQNRNEEYSFVTFASMVSVYRHALNKRDGKDFTTPENDHSPDLDASATDDNIDPTTPEPAVSPNPTEVSEAPKPDEQATAGASQSDATSSPETRIALLKAQRRRRRRGKIDWEEFRDKYGKYKPVKQPFSLWPFGFSIVLLRFLIVLALGGLIIAFVPRNVLVDIIGTVRHAVDNVRQASASEGASEPSIPAPHESTIESEAHQWERARSSRRLVDLREYVLRPDAQHRRQAISTARDRIRELRMEDASAWMDVGRSLILRELPSEDYSSQVVDPRQFSSSYEIIRTPAEGDWVVFEVADDTWPFRFSPMSAFPVQEPLAPSAFEQPSLMEPAPPLEYDDYPRRALVTGRDGEARLLLTISETGVVTNAEVLSEHPSGYGFGEAAARYATKLRFTPAVRGGRPSVGLHERTILFPIPGR